MAIFAEVTKNEFVRLPCVSDNLVDTARYLANGARQDVSWYYLLIASKSHTGFRLVPKSVTLNSVMTADPRYLCGS